jgi:lysyl-tRNA synthetase class 2
MRDKQQLNFRNIKFKKLENLKAKGISPYPSFSQRTSTCAAVVLNFDQLKDEKIFLAGRIRSIRSHGKSTFANLEDESGKIQFYLKEDLLGASKYKLFEDFDLGDFIQIEGTLFETKAGEKTVKVSDFKILAKSILPFPEKWHGLKDIELRFRKRYLDLIMNPRVKSVFQVRAKLIDAIRDFLTDDGFLEVQTPILQPIAGGADARPFVTHHNVLDIDLYLRIAPELYLKRLIVGGFEKIYELGPIFRNEGMSREHLQEFTALEYYWAYKNYKDLMEFNEKLFVYILERAFKTLKFEYQGQKIDFTPPWPRQDFHELVLKEAGIDLKKFPNKESLAKKLQELGIKFEAGAGRGRLIDILYKQKCRPKLIQPTYLINHPLDVSPLAKKSNERPDIVERFQILASGIELGNGYSELNDPIDQENRFNEQAGLRQAGDEEAHIMDEDFIEALSYGMPPTAGFGMGIDRLLVLLTNSSSVRDVVSFPQMRPEKKPVPSPAYRQAGEVEGLKKQENIKIKKQNKINPGITQEEAFELLQKELKNKNLIKHSLAVEAVMAGLAQKLGEDEGAWRICGILHDLDYEKTQDKPKEHAIVTAEILKKQSVAPQIAEAIKAHNEATGVTAETTMAKALYAVDPLTGLIVASALVKPDKKLASLDVNSVLKKFKSKSFAAGANRKAILSCQDFGLGLEEFIRIGLESMQKISDKLGL